MPSCSRALTRVAPVLVATLLLSCRAPAPERSEGPGDRRAADAPADAFPRGCVDCHVQRPDLAMDVRISTLMARWRVDAGERLTAAARDAAPPALRVVGRHPPADESLADIPGACMECHARGSATAPSFARLMHNVHLVGGDANHYVHEFGGRCEPCHKLDPRTGAWLLPSGAER